MERVLGEEGVTCGDGVPQLGKEGVIQYVGGRGVGR